MLCLMKVIFAEFLFGFVRFWLCALPWRGGLWFRFILRCRLEILGRDLVAIGIFVGRLRLRVVFR
jgi:hypothetical protein